MTAEWIPADFIDEPIEVEFERPPMLSRKPGPPDAFVWRGEHFQVEENLASWFDYERKGRSAKNMQPAHARVAAQRGSWGVGRFYFRVRAGGRVFDLYYDRAPQAAGDRQGSWFLYREMKPA